MKNVFPASERGELVQQSLSEAVTKILSIAGASKTVDEFAPTPPHPAVSNPKSQPELRAV